MKDTGCTNLYYPPLSRKAFYKRFFPHAKSQEINDWHWQLINRITTKDQLQRFISLSKDEQAAFCTAQLILPLSITPHLLSLVDPDNPKQPLRKIVIPTKHELTRHLGERVDPLCEDNNSPSPCVVHRYPDRILFLVTDFCASYCRYCTRSRVIECKPKYSQQKHWELGFEYIKSHPEIRDVLISGGDPLTMENEKLEYILRQLKQIPHIELIRIGSKVPVSLPQRITPQLCKMLKKFHPLFISIHFTHPDEFTEETKQACIRLANAGIPLGSQTVLLKDINDNLVTMKKLMHELLKIRVRPYYIYQCDPIPGSNHFRTPVKKGIEMIQGLRGHTSGYAVPHFVIDAPGGGGKIPLLPEYYLGKKGNHVLLKNYLGEIFVYPDSDE
jgi:lysine 2,3-aminomutase